MALGIRLNRSVAAWLVAAALLAGPALVSGVGALRAIDWQPGLAFSEPWRWWSPAWVHFSRMHLTMNLAGALLVAALGAAAPVGARAASAWLLAWPLTHLGLLVRPELLHYGGLSGVLHAGVAVVAIELLWQADGRRRWVGVAITAVLLVKVVSEAPWGPVLRHHADWDIAIAPLAHAMGAAAGAICALLVKLMPQPRIRRTSEVVE